MPTRVDKWPQASHYARLYVPLPEEQQYPKHELGRPSGTVLTTKDGETTVGYAHGLEAAFTDGEWARIQRIAERNPGARCNQRIHNGQGLRRTVEVLLD